MMTALATLGSSDLALNPGSPEYREHVERGAAELARTFAETTSNMRRIWEEFGEHCKNLDEVMTMGTVEEYHHNHFDVRLYYDGSQHYDHPKERAIDEIIRKMNVKVWETLINKLGVKNLMSIKRRAEFEKQLKDGDVPPVTEANIIGLIMGLADRAADFATESARETLKLLTPSSAQYKTNSGFKVGRRVILPYYVQMGWSAGTFRPSHYREAEMIAIDSTFHILDEKGLIKERKSPLLEAISTTTGGKAETAYFRFKCFKNGNLHIEFKRLDLVKKLNGLATGEYVLGQDID
jgi:hypothetical protein